MSRLLDGHSSAVDVRTASGTRIAIGLGAGGLVGLNDPPFGENITFSLLTRVDDLTNLLRLCCLHTF